MENWWLDWGSLLMIFILALWWNFSDIVLMLANVVVVCLPYPLSLELGETIHLVFCEWVYKSCEVFLSRGDCSLPGVCLEEHPLVTMWAILLWNNPFYSVSAEQSYTLACLKCLKIASISKNNISILHFLQSLYMISRVLATLGHFDEIAIKTKPLKNLHRNPRCA